MTIYNSFRESPLVKGALIFRGVLAAGAHLRAAHLFSRRLFEAAGCLSHFREMPLNRSQAERLEKESTESLKEILKKNEKKAKVFFARGREHVNGADNQYANRRSYEKS